MKIAITGHTNGIGLAMSNCFSSNGHYVVGYSRSNGFDIADSEIRNKILKSLDEFDVFINNAYSPKAQTLLLIGAIRKFENTNKVIINIGSNVIHTTFQIPKEFEQYVNDKRRLQSIVNQRRFNFSPKIINVLLGHTATKFSDHVETEKMDTNKVANLIYSLYSLRDSIAVQEIAIESPNVKL